MANRMFDWGNGFEVLQKKSLKMFCSHWISGSHFIVGTRWIGSRFGSLVTEMGAKHFSHTHRSTMCGLNKLASGVFPKNCKVLAERRRWRRRRKRTKNNMYPGDAGWLNYEISLRLYCKPVCVCFQNVVDIFTTVHRYVLARNQLLDMTIWCANIFN